MNPVSVIFKRELKAYFATPVAYVFIVIFLVLANAFAFQLGGLFERGQADLRPFFDFHPWLYLFLVPAVAMRLWAEERNTGSIELLLTLPVTQNQAVVGKFLAAWAFVGIALALTFPIWITGFRWWAADFRYCRCLVVNAGWDMGENMNDAATQVKGSDVRAEQKRLQGTEEQVGGHLAHVLDGDAAARLEAEAAREAPVMT